MKTTDRVYAMISTVVFLAMISLVMLNEPLQFSGNETVSRSEKRNLARKPFFNVGKLDPYPAEYETYFNDHFPYRQEMIKSYTLFNYRTFNKSPHPDQVLIGKNGWLYYVPKEKQIYSGYPFIKTDGIKQIADYLKKRTRWHEDRGIKFYVAFAPMKAEIYPEFLPLNYPHGRNGTVTDKIIELVKNDPEINFIELKPAILKAKSTGRLYEVTDNHWNSRGAFVAYNEIITRIKKDFPSTGYPGPADVSYKDSVIFQGNLSAMLDLSEYMPETDFIPIVKNARAAFGKTAGYKCKTWFDGYFEIVKETHDSTLPKAVVIRDSFGTTLMPYLDENFSKCVYIFDSWNYDYNTEIIENEKPDIVLLLIYEPHIHNLLDGL